MSLFYPQIPELVLCTKETFLVISRHVVGGMDAYIPPI